MAVQTRAYLKSKFETGDIPTEQDYIDFLDSIFNFTDDTIDDISGGLKKQAIAATLEIPFDKLITKIDPLTITGATEFTVNVTDAEYGNVTFIRVTADGTNIPIFAVPFQELLSSRTYDNTNGTVNIIGFWYDGVSFLYSINQPEPIAGPLLSSIVVASDNGSVVLTFNTGCYANNNGTGDLQVADFTPSLSGGTATNPVLSVPTHIAGDSTAGFTLAYTGTANGSEVLTITPADGSSIFEITGVAMDAGQTANDNLQDQVAPSFNVAEVGNIDDTTIRITMNEACDPASTPATSAFTPAGIATSPTVTNVNITGAFIDLTLSDVVVNGDTPTIAYTKPGSNFLKDTATIPNETASWTAEAVTNNVDAVFINDFSAGNKSVFSTARIVDYEPTDSAGTDLDHSWVFYLKQTRSLDHKFVFVYADDAAGTNQMIDCWVVESDHGTIPNKLRFDMYGTGGGFIHFTSSVDVADAAPSWKHIAITFNATANTKKLYIDGVEDASAAQAEAGLYTACIAGDASKIITITSGSGLVDELQNYDKELSAGEVSIMYNAGTVLDATGLATNTNLVDYRRFEQVLTDSSDSANSALEDTGPGDWWSTDSP